MSQTSVDYAATLSILHAHQSTNPISIQSLADPIIRSARSAELQPQSGENVRTSDASNSSATDALNPAFLSADLQHYRELFSKLRFSYLEQVTKEKYLRGIVGDPPILVSHQDNVALEEELVAQKAGLKTKKTEVEEMVVMMEEEARRLAGLYEHITKGKVDMERLVSAVQAVEKRKAEVDAELVERRRVIAGQSAGDGVKLAGTEEMMEMFDSRMPASLPQTEESLIARERENRELDAKIAHLQRSLPGKMRECEVVERELDGLEKRRDEAAAQAQEARTIKEAGGRDPVEEIGRWYKAAETVMNGLELGEKAKEVEVE